MKIALTVSAGLLIASTAGCSSSSGASQNAFPITVTSDGHLASVTVSAPTAPTVGTDVLDMTITRLSDGTPVDGLTVTVVPWMPAMDHGTSTPTITPKGNGVYEVSELYLFMPGTWELKTTFTGPMSDHAEPEFQIQ